MTRLVKQSASEPDMWDPVLYRGDGFEAFVETLIKLSPIDKRINIVEYSPESTNPQLKSVYLKFSLKDEEQSPTGVNKTVLPEDIEKLITTGVVQFVDDETGEVCS
jgi:hypothetical protein